MPTEAELAGTGYTAEDYDESAEIWPENWPAWSLFQIVRTQWIHGPNGAEGLNYAALYPLLDRQFKTPESWAEAFADIRCLEVAALNAMRSK